MPTQANIIDIFRQANSAAGGINASIARLGDSVIGNPVAKAAAQAAAQAKARATLCCLTHPLHQSLAVMAYWRNNGSY
jgi:hypothetical protein